jgi:predicted nucleic acid-binding protein
MVAQEPAGCEEMLREWIRLDRVTPRLWTDAYLAAFARAGRMRLVSFDRHFSRFDDLDLHLLST